MSRPATKSGRATLVELDDEDARALVPGEILITPAPSGYWQLGVWRVRESVFGEQDQEPQPCCVVDAARLPDGRTLTFAPADLLRVQVRR